MEKSIVLVVFVFFNANDAAPEINSKTPLMNKLKIIKPVGAQIGKNFMPLTEIPPPSKMHDHDGRRHMETDCDRKPAAKEVWDAGQVNIVGDYYDDRGSKTVATVIFPDHIDHRHFEITTQVPYLTVGTIDGIGYHPPTVKSEHPSECEKIYQDHMADAYSDETKDFSEESLEMARMPLFEPVGTQVPLDSDQLAAMYGDLPL